MAKKSKLTKQEFEALTDEKDKQSYELVGEFAFFTGEIPDVAGLQTALESERTLRSNAEKALAPFTGLDPVKAKEALAAQQKGAGGGEPDLTKPEGVKAAIASMQKDFDDRLKAERERADKLTIDRTIESTLIKAGVLPDALPDAMLAVRPMVKPIGEDASVLGVVGPAGTFLGTDFSTWASTELKKQKSYFFADNGQGGTGAGQSRGAGNGGSVISKTRAEFDQLTPQQKIDFSNQVDQGKAALVDNT
jgi:hypothetical protein